MKNIIFVANKDPLNTTGGIQKHLLDLLDSAGRLSIKTRILFSTRLPGFGKDNKRICGPKAIVKFLSEHRKEDTVVHIHGSCSFFLYQVALVCRYLRIRYFWTPHFHPFSAQKHPMISRFWFRYFEGAALKNSQLIFSLTEHEQCQLSNQILGLKFLKIPHGIKSVAQPKNFGIENYERYILFVGRNSYNKGIDVLADNLDIFDGLGIKLVVVSDFLDEEIINHNSVIFYKQPSDSDLSELYFNALATIIPSRYEAFSYVALESIARGVPIIISKNVMCKEYFVGHEFCYLVDFNDNNEVNEKLKTVAVLNDDERLRMSNSAIKVSGSFDKDRNCKKVLDAMLDLD